MFYWWVAQYSSSDTDKAGFHNPLPGLRYWEFNQPAFFSSFSAFSYKLLQWSLVPFSDNSRKGELQPFSSVSWKSVQLHSLAICKPTLQNELVQLAASCQGIFIKLIGFSRNSVYRRLKSISFWWCPLTDIHLLKLSNIISRLMSIIIYISEDNTVSKV